MEPLVSILIPAYNAQQWIKDTIQSALRQTWTRKEIIVIDDGSRDQTFAIANQFASREVQVVRQANQGAAVARNTAYTLCQGDYVQWLDADDLLDPDKIKVQMKVMDRCSSKFTLLSGAWAYFIYRQRRARFCPTPLWSDLTATEWMVRKMGSNLQMQTDNWLVSRELSQAAGPWDCRLWRDNDGEYFSRVILSSDGIRFVPEARSYYRMAGFKSISYIGGSSKKLESLFLSMTLHMKYLRSMEDSERTRAACVRYIKTWLFEFYPYRLDIAQQLKDIAATLGGDVSDPELSWKYNWLVKSLGWDVGRRAQLVLPKLKGSAIIAWDKAMLELERRSHTRTNELAKI